MTSNAPPNTPTTLLMEQAAAAQRQGDLAAAKKAYQAVLTLDPLNALALHAMGVACARHRQNEEALQWLNQALTVQPDNTNAWSDRGNVLSALRRFTLAIASYDKAIALAPHQAPAHYNRATALSEMGQHEEAAQGFEQAIARDPQHALAWCNQGVALNELKRHEQALACFEQALTLAPQYAEAWSNKATTLIELKRYTDALECCDQAVSLSPEFADAWCNRGNALRHLDLQEQAIAAYERAVQLNPALAQAWSNQGAALSDLERTEEAMQCFDHALQLKPDYAQAWFNRGNAFHALGEIEEASANYQQATTLQPNYDEAHWNNSLALLSMGRLTEGWLAYESRKKLDQKGWVHRVLPQPFWDGSQSLSGKTILLHCEQGFGDTLQFCRYAKAVAQKGARVLLEVQPPLKALLQSLEGPHQVFSMGEALPDFDLHCPLLSLPLALGTTLETIPSQVPYLTPDPTLLAHWRQQLGQDTRPKIGLVWSGSTTHTNDSHRSMRLAQLLPALPTHFQWVSLQKELREEDAAPLQAHPELLHFGPALRTYADTAAVCSLMDAVICVDTSVAHLAGALGRPVHLLLAANPDWRWMRERSDTPWYPSMTLWRQRKLDEWEEPLSQLNLVFA